MNKLGLNGRTPLPDEERRDTKFTICLTKEEYKRYTKQAIIGGFESVSEYFRHLADRDKTR